MTVPGVMNKKRLLVLLLATGFLFLAMIIRLGYIQLIQSDWLKEKASGQWTSELPVVPNRGRILDRNMNVLAQSASAETVMIRPSEIRNAAKKDASVEPLARRIAQTLSGILEMDEEGLYQKAISTNARELWIKRQITKEQATAIRQAELPGVHFAEDTKRYYPQQNFLSQVLGFTTIDGVGQEGLESVYDKYLTGIPGRSITESDRDGVALPFGVEQYIAPEDGQDLVLSIDYVIQSYAEKAANDAMSKYNPKGVRIIAMDPNTGGILAMVNKPDLDNNAPPRNDLTLLRDLMRNRCVQDSYEPGSTFKIVTTAAALETGVATPQSTYHCSGSILVDGKKISCWRTGNPHGSQNLVQAVQNSCNPVFVQLALQMGKEKFYSYINGFGFGSLTGVDFKGEAPGIVTPLKHVKDGDIARIGFGQSIAVTPLQLITAASASINGGKLMQPYFVSEIKSADGMTQKKVEPTVVRQVISESTSATMRSILESVVHEKVAAAQIEGYTVGGKTGTAQKYGESGEILRDAHISSFIGFAPADDPKIIVLVIVDEPQYSSHFGSVIAAPYAKMVLEDSLKHMGVKPNVSQALEKVAMPKIEGLSVADAKVKLTQAGLVGVFDGTGSVTQQLPPEGEMMTKGSEVIVVCSSKVDDEDVMVTVPDVQGKSMIEANTILTSRGLKLKVKGSGLAVSQSIGKDTQVSVGTEVVVEFREPS